jgi:lipooligosaccharide transport system permease protein
MRANSPRMTSLTFIFKIWYRNFIVFRKTFFISLFWVVLEPVFFLGALGYGLGSFVSQIQGLSYVEFFVPGLICNTAMMVAFFSSTYESFSKLTHQRLFETQVLTPITAREIALGEILWGATKGLLSALAVVGVALVVGAIHYRFLLPTLLVVFIASLGFSAFGFLVTTLVKNYDQIIYPTSGLIIPMSLFAGAYFPVDSLPDALRGISYFFPLTHAVSLSRSFLTENLIPNWQIFIHLAYLLAFLLVTSRYAVRRLDQKLTLHR